LGKAQNSGLAELARKFAHGDLGSRPAARITALAFHERSA
jgi:hypothetical protein